jgi:hypothetical protein
MSDEAHETMDQVGGDVPRGDGIVDNDYKSRSGQYQIPVQSDDKPVESGVNAATADSNEQLGTHIPSPICPWGESSWGRDILDNVSADAKSARDDHEAIDEGNIIQDRTRGATKKAGTYTEPGDEEGLPGPDDGTSNIRTGARQ